MVLENTVILLVFFQFCQLVFWYRTLAKIKSFWTHQWKRLHGGVAFVIIITVCQRAWPRQALRGCGIALRSSCLTLSVLFWWLTLRSSPLLPHFILLVFSPSPFERVLPLPPAYTVKILSAFRCLCGCVDALKVSRSHFKQLCCILICNWS